MFPSTLTIFVFSALSFITASVPSDNYSDTQLLYEFPNGTWVENLAVRSNDQLLLTILTTPDLYALDPDKINAQPTLIYSFPNATALFGIAEIEPDIFVLAAGNYSAKSGNIAGSYSIWKVDFSSCNDTSSPEISLVAPVPQATFINGMCVLPKLPDSILLGDIAAGEVWRMDTKTGDVFVAVPANNTLVSAASDPIYGSVGVDGLHILGDELYVANVGRRYLAKLKVNPDGTPFPGADPVIIYEAPNGTGVDDFALDAKGEIFLVTANGNTIVEIDSAGKQRVLAGNINSTEIAQPTSVAFSKGVGKKRLFVVTGGGLTAPVNGDEIVGGQVIAIDLS